MFKLRFEGEEMVYWAKGDWGQVVVTVPAEKQHL